MLLRAHSISPRPFSAPRLKLRNHLGRLYRNLLAPLHYSRSQSEFHRLLPKEYSSKALWQMTRRYHGHGWYAGLSAWQIESEYCGMIDWVASQNPRVILEIGTAQGATLLAWSRIASELVISIDLPRGIHGGGYPAKKEKLFREFVSGRPGVEMVIIRGDSHTDEMRDRVSAVLAGRAIEFLFIDGDHTYEGVTRDFELWTPLVTPSGQVGLHDIVPHRADLKDCEVDRFWVELKRRYKTIEFIADPNQGWAGIGILQLS